MSVQQDFTKPTPPRAARDIDATFQCSDNVIYIHNQNSRRRAYTLWIVAAFLVIFPLIRAFVPGRVWFAFDEPGAWGWFGLVVYLFAIFACISAVFEWSTIRIDLVSGQIAKEGRWGPFRSRRTTSIKEFDQVALEHDDNITVELVGSQRLQIVWRRSRAESIRIAREVAAHMKLPVVGDDE